MASWSLRMPPSPLPRVKAKDSWGLREAKPLPQRLLAGMSLVPDEAI